MSLHNQLRPIQKWPFIAKYFFWLPRPAMATARGGSKNFRTSRFGEMRFTQIPDDPSTSAVRSLSMFA
jgi:hypothetical protein